MQQFLNEDGKTYNGVALLASISGLSEAEVRWTCNRMRELMIDNDLDKTEAKRVVAEEAKSRPWEGHDGSETQSG